MISQFWHFRQCWFSFSQLSKSGLLLLLVKCSFLSCHPIPRSSNSIKYILSTKPSLLLTHFFAKLTKNKTCKGFFLVLALTCYHWTWLVVVTSSHFIVRKQQKVIPLTFLFLLTRMVTGSSDHSLIVCNIGFTKKAKYVSAFSVLTCTSCHYSRCSYCSWGSSHGLSLTFWAKLLQNFVYFSLWRL